MSVSSQTRRGRLQLILVALLFLTPFIGALLMTKFVPGYNPFGTANRGTLISPVVAVGADGLVALDGKAVDDRSFTGKWSLLVFSASDCAQDCRQRLETTQKVRLLLNKDASRVQRLLVVESSDPGWIPALLKSDQYLRVVKATSGWRQAFYVEGRDAVSSARVFVIDPQGYLMMFYEPGFEPQSMLKDLKRLLKTSRLG